MKDLAQAIRSYFSRDFEERKHWYSLVADAYGKARPRYPQALVQQRRQRRHVSAEVKYTADRYLMLLNTYLSYLKLASDQKRALFAGLRDRIEQDFCGSLALSYLSAFHIARPIALLS
jgi:hypothetical protein